MHPGYSCPFRSGVGRRWRRDLPCQAARVLAAAAGGLTAQLASLQANPAALRSYNRDIATLFGGSIRSVAEVRDRVAGPIVVMAGFGNPALTSLIEEWGGAGPIAVNPAPISIGAPARPSGAALTSPTCRASPVFRWWP